MNKQDILNSIFNRTNSIGIKYDDKGYVKTNEENLVEVYSNWPEIKEELNAGQGGELIPDKHGNVKFNAIHSSSALGVNNFATFKQHLDKFCFLSFSDFTKATFEEKLPTGISTPNLDFYLENNCTIIGFESKFTEYLSPKLPNHNGNLAKYLYNSKLGYLSKDFHDKLIKRYITVKDKLHLDVAQLIKHGIGILNRARSRYRFILNSMIVQPVLVYIYWQPVNWYNYEVFRKHAEEIEEFKQVAKEFFTFIPISYLEFWKMYENDKLFGSHIEKMKDRYLIIL